MPIVSSVHNDFEKRTVVHVLKRGEWSMPLDEVRPLPPAVLPLSTSSVSAASDIAPRTALAEWLVDRQNPLTARALVNRVWHYHFGKGIAPTPNDLGRNGQSPSHPELLDHLASRLMENDWQMKPLHRLIVLSSTYRQASTHADAACIGKWIRRISCFGDMIDGD